MLLSEKGREEEMSEDKNRARLSLMKNQRNRKQLRANTKRATRA
jgi:hypothetical protein